MTNERNNASEHADRSDVGTEGIGSTVRDLTPLPSQGSPLLEPRPRRFDGDLLVCGTCRSRLMCPTDCEEHGRDHWYIELKCADYVTRFISALYAGAIEPEDFTA